MSLRILYGINGTGNGHRSRAIELVPELRRRAEVDVLVSGARYSLQFPFDVRYRFRGLSFVYRDGGVAPLATAAEANPVQLLRDIQGLDLDGYDAVVTDFESVSAWSAKLRGIPCLHVSHQASFRCPAVPRPDPPQAMPEAFLKGLIPGDSWIGLHYRRYSRHILPPIVRTSVRDISPTRGANTVVYLPSVPIEEQIGFFSRQRGEYVLFGVGVDRSERAAPGIRVEPASDGAFARALASSRGVIAHAGFELPSEALFLGKPLFALPIARQYEQQCNAAALAALGVATASDWETARRLLPGWLHAPVSVPGAVPEISEPADLATRIAQWVERNVEVRRKRRGAA